MTGASTVPRSTTSGFAAALLAAIFLADAFLAGALAAFLAGAGSSAASTVALALAFLAGAFAAALAGAFLAAVEVAARLLVAATAREVEASTCTEIPRPLRCTRSAFRNRGSTPASSLARRTSSGVTVPVGVALETRAAMEGCDSTSAGSNLRACEDTNTSRRTTSGRGKAR